jgi:hypothetical protein
MQNLNFSLLIAGHLIQSNSRKGFILLPLLICLGCQSANKSEQILTAEPFALQSESLREEAGIVAIVDSGLLSKAKSWDYVTEEAGTYQLAMAWVEVLTEGEVELSIRLAGKTIRKINARRGSGPARFEMRMEEVAAGTAIEVHTRPDTGVDYRLSFHLALTTPTFANWKIFSVKAFGAVGDGQTDDFAAIQRAVVAARQAGGGIIQFEAGKTYRVIGHDDLTPEHVFPLENARNIKVQGNGARLILHPPDGLANIRNARNIHIDNLYIDYDPIPYYQGYITNINLEQMTIDIEVPERYPVPLLGRNQHTEPFFGRSFSPYYAGSRSGSGNNIYIDYVERIGSEREIRLHMPSSAVGSDTPTAPMLPRLQYAVDTGATEFVVPHLLYGHFYGQTFIHNSSRVKLSNLHWSMVPYFWLDTRYNSGPVTFSNLKLKTANPKTELYVSWRDGMHIKNGRFGMLIDSCEMDGAAMYDDVFAIFTRVHKVAAIDDLTLEMNPTFRGQKDFDAWWAGDWVSVWNDDQSELRGMSRLISAKDVDNEDRFYLTLESLPLGTRVGDTLINEEILNRNTLIRNCRTSDLGTGEATTRFRATNIVFEGNHFEEFRFNLEFNPFWGTPRSREVLVKNTTIAMNRVPKHRQSSVLLQWPIDVKFENSRIQGLSLHASRNARNIELINVEWINSPEVFLHLGPNSEARLLGGLSVDGIPLLENDERFKTRIQLHPTASFQFLPDPGLAMDN